VCKIALYVKFCAKRVLYVNSRVTFRIRIYIGPTNLNWVQAHKYINWP